MLIIIKPRLGGFRCSCIDHPLGGTQRTIRVPGLQINIFTGYAAEAIVRATNTLRRHPERIKALTAWGYYLDEQREKEVAQRTQALENSNEYLHRQLEAKTNLLGETLNDNIALARSLMVLSRSQDRC